MKIGLYMYDRPIELDDESTDLFLDQYDKAREEMIRMLDMFEEEETRVAMFHMMTLRCFIDDFLEFCSDGIDVDEMEALLNSSVKCDLDDFEEDDEFEIEVEFDDDEEE